MAHNKIPKNISQHMAVVPYIVHMYFRHATLRKTGEPPELSVLEWRNHPGWLAAEGKDDSRKRDQVVRVWHGAD